MPPTLDQIAEQVDELCANRPGRIWYLPEMARVIHRKLKSSTPYISKGLEQLAQDGRVKMLRVGPSGALHLPAEEKLSDMGLPYLHPDYASDPDNGTVLMKHPGLGSLWAGDRVRLYVLSMDSWDALLPGLQEEHERRVQEKAAKRGEDRAARAAALEAAVPGYTEVRDMLLARCPGSEAEVFLRATREEPRVDLHLQDVPVEQFKVVIELLRKGLEAS
jgi:hypothetical protein